MQVLRVADYLENLIDYEIDMGDVKGASLDSRSIKPGEIFFASKGATFNGNLYAQAALVKGACLAVMDDETVYRTIKGNKALVKNTLKALLAMGRKRLLETEAVKIAVSGSYGKTSTKEMLRLVLQRKFKTQVTDYNNNNELGVALTACGLHEETQVLVLELGSNNLGEISALSKMARPDIAILTGLGHAHVGRFGNLAEIAYEKLSIADGINRSGTMIVNEMFKKGLALKDKFLSDNALVFGTGEDVDIRLADCEIAGRTMKFKAVHGDREYRCCMNYPAPHLAENFLAAIGVAEKLTIPSEDIEAAAKSYEIPSGRGNIIVCGAITIIDDTYNASLEAVIRSIESLMLYEGEPKYALIGELGEVNKYEKNIYDAIYEKAKKSPGIKFILSGNSYARFADTSHIKIVFNEGDTEKEVAKIESGLLLIKASRSYAFERYRDIIITQQGGCDAL